MISRATWLSVRSSRRRPTGRWGQISGNANRPRGFARYGREVRPQGEEKEIDTAERFPATAETPAQFKENEEVREVAGIQTEPAKELAKEGGIPIAPTDKY
ncbi:hypothetical protein [Candidatus Amarobacter glycogenicus]|uniref:hypothetical protein n=1 Tax=Candidatus Amarobacter glycogenicus TaxID=3140699 RepID=UPI002A11EE46|nr:hypothetical protein [Dehalococcoidia bacterium]